VKAFPDTGVWDKVKDVENAKVLPEGMKHLQTYAGVHKEPLTAETRTADTVADRNAADKVPERPQVINPPAPSNDASVALIEKLLQSASAASSRGGSVQPSEHDTALRTIKNLQMQNRFMNWAVSLGITNANDATGRTYSNFVDYVKRDPTTALELQVFDEMNRHLGIWPDAGSLAAYIHWKQMTGGSKPNMLDWTYYQVCLQRSNGVLPSAEQYQSFVAAYTQELALAASPTTPAINAAGTRDW